MSQATSANSTVKTFIAGGVIHPGHCVIASGTEVVESAGANTADGIYIGDDVCADHDHVSVCVDGPCRAWCDATAAIGLFANLASDGSGHCVVDTTDKHKLIGQALEPLAAGLAFVEINVNVGWLAV